MTIEIVVAGVAILYGLYKHFGLTAIEAKLTAVKAELINVEVESVTDVKSVIARVRAKL